MDLATGNDVECIPCEQQVDCYNLGFGGGFSSGECTYETWIGSCERSCPNNANNPNRSEFCQYYYGDQDCPGYDSDLTAERTIIVNGENLTRPPIDVPRRKCLRSNGNTLILTGRRHDMFDSEFEANSQFAPGADHPGTFKSHTASTDYPIGHGIIVECPAGKSSDGNYFGNDCNSYTCIHPFDTSGYELNTDSEVILDVNDFTLDIQGCSNGYFDDRGYETNYNQLYIESFTGGTLTLKVNFGDDESEFQNFINYKNDYIVIFNHIEDDNCNLNENKKFWISDRNFLINNNDKEVTFELKGINDNYGEINLLNIITRPENNDITQCNLTVNFKLHKKVGFSIPCLNDNEEYTLSGCQQCFGQFNDTEEICTIYYEKQGDEHCIINESGDWITKCAFTMNSGYYVDGNGIVKTCPAVTSGNYQSSPCGISGIGTIEECTPIDNINEGEQNIRITCSSSDDSQIEVITGPEGDTRKCADSYFYVPANSGIFITDDNTIVDNLSSDQCIHCPIVENAATGTTYICEARGVNSVPAECDTGFVWIEVEGQCIPESEAGTCSENSDTICNTGYHYNSGVDDIRPANNENCCTINMCMMTDNTQHDGYNIQGTDLEFPYSDSEAAIPDGFSISCAPGYELDIDNFDEIKYTCLNTSNPYAATTYENLTFVGCVPSGNCDENQHVGGNTCMDCNEGINFAGDDPTGADTSCLDKITCSNVFGAQDMINEDIKTKLNEDHSEVDADTITHEDLLNLIISGDFTNTDDVFRYIFPTSNSRRSYKDTITPEYLFFALLKYYVELIYASDSAPNSEDLITIKNSLVNKIDDLRLGEYNYPNINHNFINRQRIQGYINDVFNNIDNSSIVMNSFCSHGHRLSFNSNNEIIETDNFLKEFKCKCCGIPELDTESGPEETSLTSNEEAAAAAAAAHVASLGGPSGGNRIGNAEIEVYNNLCSI